MKYSMGEHRGLSAAPVSTMRGDITIPSAFGALLVIIRHGHADADDTAPVRSSRASTLQFMISSVICDARPAEPSAPSAR